LHDPSSCGPSITAASVLVPPTSTPTRNIVPAVLPIGMRRL
jgi:hypothetical protein